MEDIGDSKMSEYLEFSNQYTNIIGSDIASDSAYSIGAT